MCIDEKGINKVITRIFGYSKQYRGSLSSLKDMESVFQLEKGKWHMGLPFYCIVNNVILEYIFSLGGNMEIEKQLNEIYGGDKWKVKALKSIQYVKSAQQGDAPETSAIKNPTPCSVAALLPPRLGVLNSTGPGDL